MRQIRGLWCSFWKRLVIGCCVVSLSPPRQFLLHTHIQEAELSQKQCGSMGVPFVTDDAALVMAVVSLQRAAVSFAFAVLSV